MVNQNHFEVFRARLKTLMNENRCTQKELADAIHISKQAVNNYFKKDILPDVVTLEDIANHFHTSTDYLLGKSETRINADDLRMALNALDANAIKRITVLMQGEANAGLQFINELLNADEFYKALVYLNTACKIKRLKDIEPSEQSKAYIDAVKITNAFESTSEVIASADRVIKSYIGDATEVMSKVFRDIVDSKEV